MYGWSLTQRGLNISFDTIDKPLTSWKPPQLIYLGNVSLLSVSIHVLLHSRLKRMLCSALAVWQEISACNPKIETPWKNQGREHKILRYKGWTSAKRTRQNKGKNEVTQWRYAQLYSHQVKNYELNLGWMLTFDCASTSNSDTTDHCRREVYAKEWTPEWACRAFSPSETQISDIRTRNQ